MAKTEKFRSYEDEQRAKSTWLVCPDAAIPVGSVELGRKVAAELPCGHAHAVVEVDLRPRDWTPLFTFWREHAYAHSANSVTVGVLEPRVSGAVLRDEWPGADGLTPLVNRAIRQAETRRDRPLVSVAV